MISCNSISCFLKVCQAYNGGSATCGEASTEQMLERDGDYYIEYTGGEDGRYVSHKS